LLFNKSRFKYLRRLILRVSGRKPREPLRVELTYNIPLRSHIYIYNTGSYFYSGWAPNEYEVKRYLLEKARNLKPCIFIDVGAFIGFYSLLLAGEGCDVIAFEPDPRSFKLLMHNIVIIGLQDRVMVINKAVCDRVSSTIEFKLAKEPDISSSTTFLSEDHVEYRYLAPCTTLDSILSNLKPNINVIIKIDVEGGGLNLIRGGISTIERFKPHIVLEVHRTFDVSDELLILNLLKTYNYKWKILGMRDPRNFHVALEPPP